MVVVLPQPLEPRKPKISPRSMRKLTRSTAVKSPKRMVRPSASMAMRVGRRRPRRDRPRRWPRRRSSGSSAMKAASSVSAPVRAQLRRRAGGQHRPASIATSQSKRSASSM
jgi:hypothetical protein